MTEWQFWGDRQILSVYENIYLRTFVKDWFKIIKVFASKIKGQKILDIGCGEGHTTKQILDRLNLDYKCDLLEPDQHALDAAKEFLSFENKIGKRFLDTLSSFKPIKRYDVIFTSHTNYYWAARKEEYLKQLDKFISLINERGLALVLTLPKDSDHYNIMLHQVYPSFNYSEFMSNYYKSKGFIVNKIRFKMRMFIGDLLTNKNRYDLMNFYKFIHNTISFPTESNAKEFLQKIKKYQKQGYLDFKDELLIITKKEI